MLEIAYLLEVAYQYNSGIYADTLTSAEGCDSIVQTAVNIINTPTLTQDTLGNLCKEIVYLLAEVINLPQGLYEDTLIAQGGCDSIIVTALNVNPITVYSDTVYVFWRQCFCWRSIPIQYWVVF